MRRTTGPRKTRAGRGLVPALVAAAIMSWTGPPVHAFEIAGTASFGAFQVGTSTLFAVAPGLAVRLGARDGLNLVLQDDLVLFPGPGRFGLDNRFSVGVGYSWPTVSIDAAASVSGYWLPACGTTLCGQVMGVAPGGRARVSYYPLDNFGVSVTGYLGWYGGDSLVLPGSVAATVVVGPSLRWAR